MNIHTKPPWSVNDYRLLAQFMLYADAKPDTYKKYRNHYEMIDALASTLMHLDRLRAGHEKRLSFHIGNRFVKLGDWMT